MGFFQELIDRFKNVILPSNSSTGLNRKRQGEELVGHCDPKVRRTENQRVFGDYVYGSQELRGSYSGVLNSKLLKSKFNQVNISKWDQNGKENIAHYLSTPLNGLENPKMNHLKTSPEDAILEIQVMEQRSLARTDRGNVKMRTVSHPVNSSSADNVVLQRPSNSSWSSKEVEVVKILPARQCNERYNSSFRAPSSARKPFKQTINPSSFEASSAAVRFTSCRPLVNSPQQSELEALPTLSITNGVSSRLYSSQSRSQSSGSNYSKHGNTLSRVKDAEGHQTYNRMVMNSLIMESPPPFQIGLPTARRRAQEDTSRNNLKSVVFHQQLPTEPLAPKEASNQASKKISIPVERNHGKEPSTSATRQQPDDSELEYIGQVHTSHFPHPGYGEDFLNDILTKYERMDKKKEAEEKEREIRLIEERNKCAQDARKMLAEEHLAEQCKVYLKIVEDYKDETEDEVVELPRITSEMEKEIDAALNAPPNKELSSGFNLTIKGMDMHTLRSLKWLNDEVINFYMNLIIERGKADNYPSVYSFNTFFYPQLINPIKGYDSLKRWTKKVDVFGYDYVLVPVHRGMHWCMAIIYMKDKIIRYFDSMNGHYPQCTDALLNYLQRESMDKKKKPFDTTDWQKVHAEDIPQQNNGSDCGVFACMYAEYVSRGAKIDFSQENMPYFRRKIVYEILKKKLLT